MYYWNLWQAAHRFHDNACYDPRIVSYLNERTERLLHKITLLTPFCGVNVSYSRNASPPRGQASPKTPFFRWQKKKKSTQKPARRRTCSRRTLAVTPLAYVGEKKEEVSRRGCREGVEYVRRGAHTRRRGGGPGAPRAPPSCAEVPSFRLIDIDSKMAAEWQRCVRPQHTYRPILRAATPPLRGGVLFAFTAHPAPPPPSPPRFRHPQLDLLESTSRGG